MKPLTHYTKSGSINIAYQIVGSGPTDLVYIPGWVSNIDLMWDCPPLAHFLRELGNICRVILFDKRGTGLSDRISELSTLEERMDDIRAVMDAVNSQKAILFGHSEGGSVSALFSATYPQRTIALIAFGIFAKRRYTADYPWAPTDQERQKVYDMIENSWGGGDMALETLAPSRANDMDFMDWLARYFRSGASPSAAMTLTKMNTLVDIVDILPAVRIPVLLLQRKLDIDVKIEEGRYISKKIPNAQFVELEGDDHLFWAGDSLEVLDLVRDFVRSPIPETPQVKLTTLLTIRHPFANRHSIPDVQPLMRIIEKFRGRMIRSDQSGCLIAFEGPSKAVYCGLSLLELDKQNSAGLAICVHMLETSLSGAPLPQNILDGWLEEMTAKALPHQLLVSQTVKNLLVGAGLDIRPSPYVLKPKGQIAKELFHVSDPNTWILSKPTLPTFPDHSSDSFLEDVIRCIDNNLDNEDFNLDSLSKELAVSDRQLQRKLKALSNKTPQQLISSVRLHRAKELLISRRFDIAEIAYKTGFSNPSYFAKCFKKEFGFKPSSLK